MCGLYGWIQTSTTKPALNKSTLAAVLSAFNDDRGGDSYGFFGSKTRTPVKGMGHAALMGPKRSSLLVEQEWVIAHTRKASTGRVTKKNAHPFDLGDIVGAHNGMVTNHEELNSVYGRRYEVDSEHIFAHFQDACDSFRDIEAYGAVTLVNRTEPGTVFAGTFNSGEFCLARLPGFGLVWSSEKSAMEVAARCCGIAKPRYIPLKEGRLYALDVDGGVSTTAVDLDFTEPYYGFSWALRSQTGSKCGPGSAGSYSEYGHGWPEDDKDYYLGK